MTLRKWVPAVAPRAGSEKAMLGAARRASLSFAEAEMSGLAEPG